jgi:hypothetical protein
MGQTGETCQEVKIGLHRLSSSVAPKKWSEHR